MRGGSDFRFYLVHRRLQLRRVGRVEIAPMTLARDTLDVFALPSREIEANDVDVNIEAGRGKLPRPPRVDHHGIPPRCGASPDKGNKSVHARCIRVMGRAETGDRL